MSREQFGEAWREKFFGVIERFRGEKDHSICEGHENICHIPAVAPLAYLITKYPGISAEGMEHAQREITTTLPQPLIEFLKWSNGLRLFHRFSLHGTLGETPQPISLKYQNLFDRLADQPVDVVGLGSVTGARTKADYFLHPDGHVDLVAGDRISDVVHSWSRYDEMVLDELGWFSRFYDDVGKPTVEVSDMLRPKHREWERLKPKTEWELRK